MISDAILVNIAFMACFDKIENRPAFDVQNSHFTVANTIDERAEW